VKARRTKAQVEGEIAARLVERAKAGDRSAFDALVRRYRGRVYALALHLTRNESDADDIAQEVFISAYRALSGFAGRSEFFTWVYRMAVNRSLSARRRRDRRGETPMDDPRVERAVVVDSRGDPVRASELRQTYARLLAALDRLPPEMRTTVVLVALQGFSHGEVAVIQSCSPGTVAWRIHEARKHLRKALENGGIGTTDLSRSRRSLSVELRQLLCDVGLPILAPSKA
jgi:RNA polymerase sigma-70 factor (ECF subfamily)